MAQTLAPAFGDLLKQLRKRAGMTQGDLAAAVGYSVSFVSVLEQNRRLPPVDAILQVFVPALGLQDEPHLAMRLVELAANARGERPPIAITRQRETQIAVTEAANERLPPLPAAPTDLIGRAQELQQLCQRLPGHRGRLLTLVGPPGIGKTQLALAVATQLQYHYPDGAAFVALAAVSDAVVMAATIAASLGCSDASPKSPTTKLIECLRSKAMLLVLDNLEQIRDGGPLIAELLAQCPGLCVLATSRERLHLRAEQRFAVLPLDLAHAIALFVRCAQGVNADFRLTPENQPTLAAICQRLDRLPLALELCAAQIDLLSPAQLLTQLQDRRLDLLVEGAHDLPPRQRTLRAAIQHSYLLLDEEERTLFRRLGIFVGGFDLPTVAAVVADNIATAARPFTAVFHGLIGKSLVRAETLPSGEQRFVLLEIIREYALELLKLSGEVNVIRERHATYYLALTEEAEAKLHEQGEKLWLNRLEREYDNLRAALGWLMEQEQPEAGLRLAAALWRFWASRGGLHEGRQWLAKLLTQAERIDAPTLVLAKALHAAGVLARYQGDYDQATTLYEKSLALRQELGDKLEIAWSLTHLGNINRDKGRYDQAVLQYEKSLALFQEADDKRAIAILLQHLGRVALMRQAYEQATTYIEQGLILSREQENDDTTGWLLRDLGKVAQNQGDRRRAITLLDESLDLFRNVRDKLGIAWSLTDRGNIARDQGRYDQARALYTESLALFQVLGIKTGIVLEIVGLAQIAKEEGQKLRSARLFGAAEALGETGGEILPPSGRAEHDQEVAAARIQLDDTTVAAAWAAGRTLTLEQAIAEALRGSTMDNDASLQDLGQPG